MEISSHLLLRRPVSRDLVVLPGRDVGHLELDVLERGEDAPGRELPERVAPLRHDLVKLLGLLHRHFRLELSEAAEVVDGGALVLLLRPAREINIKYRVRANGPLYVMNVRWKIADTCTCKFPP